MSKKKQNQINLWYAVIAIVLITLFQMWLGVGQTIERIPYSEFLQSLRDGRIARMGTTDEILPGLETAQLG